MEYNFEFRLDMGCSCMEECEEDLEDSAGVELTDDQAAAIGELFRQVDLEEPANEIMEENLPEIHQKIMSILLSATYDAFRIQAYENELYDIDKYDLMQEDIDSGDFSPSDSSINTEELDDDELETLLEQWQEWENDKIWGMPTKKKSEYLLNRYGIEVDNIFEEDIEYFVPEELIKK